MIEAKGVNGRVTFDGVFVTITRKGLFNAAGKGEKRIPVSNITAVRWKTPARHVGTAGYIRFTVPGGQEVHGSSQVYREGSDENAVLFGNKQKSEFTALREAVEAAIKAHSANQITGAAGSVADELAKLRQLVNQGVLTEAEFEEQKARTLK